MRSLLSKRFVLFFILMVTVLIPLSVNAGNETKKINIDEEEFFKNEEEKVVISIIKFGRKNPFKPYTPSEEVHLRKEIIDIDDIPFPPTYSDNTEIGKQAEILMNSKVNGILFDPYAKSVAIVNIQGLEYMLHKGDMVQGITVDRIAQNNITLRYGSNTYTVGVGDAVEGGLYHDPVTRKQKIFAGSNSVEYNLPDIDLEE